jgi:TPR repeat protein
MASGKTKKGWRTQPLVTYSYSVDGKAYASSKVSLAAIIPAKETEPTLARYPVSQPVNVHYQPGNPAVAVLEAGPNRNVSSVLNMYVYLFVVILLVNIANVGVDIWTANHNSDTPTAPTYDDKTAADPQLGNRLLRDDAEKGNAQDQMYVGMWYLTGTEGYTKDPAEAVKWLQKSADQGNSDGENMLGNLYAGGIGVDKDLTKAVDLFQKSAAQNNPHACASLGRAYEKGVGGLPQDNAQAIEWYRKAGDDPHAKEGLARLNAQ